MAEDNSINKIIQNKMEKALQAVIDTIPDEFVVQGPNGEAISKNPEDDLVKLTDGEKRAIAGVMILTGEDFETTVLSSLTNYLDEYREDDNSDEEE